jgi:hypothetical protein
MLAAAALFAAGIPSPRASAPEEAALVEPLSAQDLAATHGGMESRITNVGSTDPLVGTLSADKSLHFEVTTSMTADFAQTFIVVTASAFTPSGSPIPLPVSLKGVTSLGTSTLGEGGAVAAYKVDMSAFCSANPGNWSVLVTATFNNSAIIRTQSMRLVACS